MGHAAFEEFMTSLLAWEAGRCGGTPAYKLRDTVDYLERAGAFPHHPKVTAVIEELSLSHAYAATDLVRIINGICSRVPDAEAALGVDDILSESMAMEPANALEDRHPALCEALERSLVLGCLFQDLLQKPFPAIICGGLDVERVSLKGILLLVEPPVLEMPFEIVGSLKACCGFHKVATSIDPVKLWLDAVDDDDREAAFSLFCGPDTGSRRPWKFGAAFSESATNLEFQADYGRAQRLLRAMKSTIEIAAVKLTHKLRTGAGGNDPQRTRNKGLDKAWRRDIDYEYHLHYWDGEVVEFAKVVIHADMTIPE